MLWYIIFFAVLLWMLNNFTKKHFNRTYLQYWKDVLSGKFEKGKLQDLANKHNQGQIGTYTLFVRFKQMTGMSSLEVFRLARDHMGFGYSDIQVESHLNASMHPGIDKIDLPNYVEAFLEQGRKHILGTKEEKDHGQKVF